MWVIGNLTYVDDETLQMTPDKSPAVTFERVARNPDIVRQAPAFFRKGFIERAGGWNPDYFMAMDFDLWIRLAKVSAPRMVNSNWAFFRLHAHQKTSHANVIRQKKEIMTILRRERAKWSWIAALSLRKRWYWAKGLLKARLIDAGFIRKARSIKAHTA
jgi:hypothetical protein